MKRVDPRVLVVSFARSVETFGVSFLIVVLPLFLASDRIDITELTNQTLLGFPVSESLLIGIAISAAIIASSVGQPITGRLTDKTERRVAFMVCGLVILTVTLPFYLIAETYWTVLALRAFQGVGGALTVPAAIALVNEYSVADSKHGENMGIYNTFRLLGLGIGPMIAGAVISWGPYTLGTLHIPGIDAAFYCAILCSLLGLALVALFIDDPPRPDERDSDSHTVRDLIGTPEFKTVIIFAFATFWLAASINVFSTLENQVNARFDQTATWFGIQFAAAVLANVLGQIPVGRASDLYRKKPFIVAGFLILIPAITLQGFAMTTLQMTLLRALQGVAVALVFIPTLAFVGEIAGREQAGLYLSVITSAFALGLAVGPIASGALYTLGGFSLPFVVSGACSVIGLALVLLFVSRDT